MDLEENTTRIRKALGNVTADLGLLNESREELLVALMRQPEDPELVAQLDQIERDIGASQRQLERLTTTLSAAARVDTAAIQLEAQQRRRSAGQHRAAELTKRADAFQHLTMRWAELLEILNEIHAQTIAARRYGIEAGLVRPTDLEDGFMACVGAALAVPAMEAGLAPVMEPYIRFQRPMPSYQVGRTVMATLTTLDLAQTRAEAARRQAENMP